MSFHDYPSDWEQRRKSALNRDDFECQGCGIDDSEARAEYDVGLHVHHLKPIAEGGGHSIDNLISLCQECHVETHSKVEEQPYDPVVWMVCLNCGREFSSLEGHNRDYCSKRCLAGKEVEKAMNVVDNDARICSTCFSEVNSGSEECPNCGNWDICKRNEELLEVGMVDWEHLLLRVLYWQIFGE